MMIDNHADTYFVFLEVLKRPLFASIDQTSFAVVQRFLKKSQGVLCADRGERLLTLYLSMA